MTSSPRAPCMWAVRQDRRLKLVRVPARRRGSITTKTTDRRDRLNRAIRSKWGYICGFLMSLLVIAFTALSDLSVVFKVGVILIHVPFLIVPLWHLLGVLGDWPWSLDAEVNRGARESVRGDVTAAQVLAWILCIVAGLIPAVKEFVIASGFLLGLMGPGPWVGLLLAISKTHWTKKSAEKAGAPIVHAADASTPAAATTPVPVAACGSEGHSDVTVMAERSRAGEEGADAAKRLLVKNAQERRSLPTVVVIGAVSCALIVRYLRRYT